MSSDEEDDFGSGDLPGFSGSQGSLTDIRTLKPNPSPLMTPTTSGIKAISQSGCTYFNMTYFDIMIIMENICNNKKWLS